MKNAPSFLAALLAVAGLSSAAHAGTVSVNQHNLINASVVAVIGNNTNVVVTQSGLVNGSSIGEVGTGLKATVTQVGMHNVSAIVQAQ